MTDTMDTTGTPGTTDTPAAGSTAGGPTGRAVSREHRVHLARTRRELEDVEKDYFSDSTGTVVVMTMGALHEGHATLIREARRRAGEHGMVVVTVFVNPLQFGPNEDYDRYPRTLEADVDVCRDSGADVVFAPTVEAVYPHGAPQVRIAAGPMGERWEGASRPGHFDGMLTVVHRLLRLTRADVALFGEKDAQQLALIRRMVLDLGLDQEVTIVGVPTVREADHVALSSRNRYLSEAERASARALSRALFAGEAALERGPGAVRAAASAVLEDAALLDPPVRVDYLALVDPADFTEVPEEHQGEAVLAVAAKVGTTRLIDNVRLAFGPRGAGR
ncbi:pantoate--beta-alanine ligase [Streptomyces sp. URMC 123]|uniref:pantoate--beta-alanine ligase n=1 Tax=Streptomyces sp. URMC 123 TaxID=3423403 RepID=UPI003F1BDFAC